MFPKSSKTRKSHNVFFCEFCDYTTYRSNDYEKHIKTNAHTKKCVSIKTIKCQKVAFHCENCDRGYKTRSGLWKHEQNCKSRKAKSRSKVFPKNSQNSHGEISETVYAAKYKDEYIEKLENIITSCQIGSHNNINSNNNSNNTNNISINVFLNEHCADAKSLQDFIDEIKFKLTDVFDGTLPIKNSVSNVVVKQLNGLSITERPIHCTDKKRGNFMVKDKEEGWISDDGDKITQNIKKVQQKAILETYYAFDKYYQPPHPATIQDKKDAIVNPLRTNMIKTNSKIIADVADATSIKDAIKTLQDKK